MAESYLTRTKPRYSLRESSKVTSRYRDYIEEQGTTTTQGQNSTQATLQNRRTTQGPTPGKRHDIEATLKQEYQPESGQIQQIVVGVNNNQTLDDGSIETGPGVNTMEYAADEITTDSIHRPKPAYKYPIHQQQHVLSYDRRLYGGADLSEELKSNLRKLKNVLKLPKARPFVFCEFYYSGVDQQIFLAENEFSQLMHESFPNLKCQKLRKPEWREIRRLIGKPRRCSQAFLDEERAALEDKRQKIREIYNGQCIAMTEEMCDLPANLPRPPVVGQKIYARVRSPKDGIYAATVDAVTNDGYRVVFDDDNFPPCVIKDYEVMFDQPSELLSINYFLEQNRALARGSKSAPHQSVIPISIGSYPQTNFDNMLSEMAMGKNISLPRHGSAENDGGSNKKVAIAKDEKVGNFPVRMLVILVKLCKVIEYRKHLIGQLTLMNDYAEKMNILDNEYPDIFKVQFSQLVLDIETINRLFRNYLSALETHYTTLLPHLNEPQPTDRPELLRKTCNTHAFQIVKHCNSELNVRDKGILHLITSLTSILLQLRTIGIHKKKFSISDMNILSESLKQIRSQIAPNNAAAFQDYVEVHIKQMLKMMTTK